MPGLIRAVRSRIRPDRPDGVQVRVVVREPFVAAAGAQQVWIAREIRGRDEIDVKRRLVRIAIGAPGIVLAHAPLATRSVFCTSNAPS